MRSKGSWRVLLMPNCNFSMAPTYFTRNSAHVSDVLLPSGGASQRVKTREKEGGIKKRKQRLTGALGGVCVEAGDCAGPGEPSQTGVHGLLKRTREDFNIDLTREKVAVSRWNALELTHFAFGADLTALRAAAAVALFAFPEHCSPWRTTSSPVSSATWNTTDHGVKHTTGPSTQVNNNLYSLKSQD